ncbi:MAG: ABC-2 family transporter protein [Spirochaetales bacterium]
MRRFFSIYAAFLSQQVKALVEYKLDFLIGVIALSIQQIGSFLVLFAVFTQIKAVGGWSFDEMLLFYGWSQVVRGIDHIYNDNIWLVGWWRIRDGSFTHYLLRPIGIIQHIIMERVQFDGFGELLVGFLLFAYAWLRLGLALGPAELGMLLVFLVCGLALYFGIKLAAAAVAFWTVSSGELMQVAYEVNSFTKYPLDIYKNVWLKNFLLFVLPFAVVSYVPMAWFLRDTAALSAALGFDVVSKTWVPVGMALLSAAFVGFGFVLFRIGLRRYTGTGT